MPNGTDPSGKVCQQVCCCCAENVKIQNVKKIQNGNLYGHSFETVMSVSYVVVKKGKQGDCTLEWWEKTNRGYVPRMTNNIWHDMTKNPQLIS